MVETGLTTDRFHEDELILFIDRKERRYLTRLIREKIFHTHAGGLDLSSVIGDEEGSQHYTSKGQALIALRPTLADFILEMPRATQIIYPKDLGAILIRGDISNGATAIEAGLGSGALTMALLRAVGREGQVFSYEIREEFVEKALKNIHSFLGETPNLTVRAQDIALGIQEHAVNTILLDLPEPWELLPSARTALRPGGIFLSYLPTVLQVHRLVQELQTNGFLRIETVEVLERPWSVSARSIRPAHRMVAHTGFITTARRGAGGSGEHNFDNVVNGSLTGSRE